MLVLIVNKICVKCYVRKFVKISEISKYLDISGKCVSIKSGVEEKITVNFGNSQFFSESVGSFAIEN